jgi:hypothetical protein
MQEDPKVETNLDYIVTPRLKKKTLQSWVWWYTSVIPALRRLRFVSSGEL